MCKKILFGLSYKKGKAYKKCNFLLLLSHKTKITGYLFKHTYLLPNFEKLMEKRINKTAMKHYIIPATDSNQIMWNVTWMRSLLIYCMP